MEESFWLNVAEKFGIPLALLIAIGVGFYKASRWVGVNMVLPIQVRHMLFLDRLESGINKICDAQVQHTVEIKELTSHCKNSNTTKPQEKT